MEDDLNCFMNGRQPKFFQKWNTTSILGEMEDDLIFLENRRQPETLGFRISSYNCSLLHLMQFQPQIKCVKQRTLKTAIPL